METGHCEICRRMRYTHLQRGYRVGGRPDNDERFFFMIRANTDDGLLGWVMLDDVYLKIGGHAQYRSACCGDAARIWWMPEYDLVVCL